MASDNPGMSATVVNAVVCEQILVARKATLVNVGPRWQSPPASVAIWIELDNPSESEFTVCVEVWRGKHFVGASPIELVLMGQPHWQSTFEWERIFEFEQKTYTFAILVNDVSVRTIGADFGAPEES